MSISLTRVFLPLILVLAFVARWEPARTLRLASDERDLGASRWLIDDPDTCQHLRRIELAIAGDKVVAFDRFVNHPDGGEIPALPLYDTVVAGIAERFLHTPAGEPDLGQVAEADLEDLVIKLSPILGVLMVLATWLAARHVVTGPRGDAAALVAAAVVALHPATIAVSSAGTLAPLSLACILLALMIRSVVRSLSAETMLPAILDALIAGALAGLLTACTSLGLLLFLPAWIAFLVNALRSSDEARAKAVRAGLLYCLVAAFIGRMPLNEGPWEEGAGIVRGFLSGVSMLLFLSIAPFVVMLLLAKGTKTRPFQAACFVAALVLMVWQLPQAWHDMGPAVRWAVAEHDLIRAVTGFPDLPDPVSVFIVLCAAIAIIFAWRDRRQAITFTLIVFASVAVPVAILVPTSESIWIVAVACLLARGLDIAWISDSPRLRRAALLASTGLVSIFLVGASVHWVLRDDPAQREKRIAFVSGLRWMRTGTESGGAWNSPRSPSTWGVLSTVADGPLVQYHARRPALVSPWAVLSGSRAIEAASKSWWEDLPRFERFLAGQRARYVVVPGNWRWSMDLEPPFHAEKARFERWKLLNPLPDAAGRPPARVGNLERVHAHGLLVDSSGNPVEPVISIWRLDASEIAPARPEMRAR